MIGIDLPMQDAVWLSRLTDSNRLVERYREGRVARPKFFRILTIPTNAPHLNRSLIQAWEPRTSTIGPGVEFFRHGEAHPLPAYSPHPSPEKSEGWGAHIGVRMKIKNKDAPPAQGPGSQFSDPCSLYFTSCPGA